MSINSTKTLDEVLAATGKPYGGEIKDCNFMTFQVPELEGRTEVTIATGNLFDDPRNRFGFRGNFGMRTSYIIERGADWIETRNTVYKYED